MTSLIELLATLISFKSVTPKSKGVIEYVSQILESKGFTCHIKEFGEGENAVLNLYAYNSSKPKLCFAGHLDVVPVGDKSAWNADPFVLQLNEDKLIGRGVVDMKGAVAAFIDALSRLDTNKDLALLLTMDEEGPATNGTVKMLEYIATNGLPMFTHCIVGEPTSEESIADTIKIGRRGSISVQIEVFGTQGHVAYPNKALNPANILIKILNDLKFKWVIDNGNEMFDPSNLEITAISMENIASNVIPGSAKATLNIRYNNSVNKEYLKGKIDAYVSHHSENHSISYFEGAEPFLSGCNEFEGKVSDAIFEVIGKRPNISTSGGTSDARFISKYSKTIELGLRNETAHKINENCTTPEIQALSEIYYKILKRF